MLPIKKQILIFVGVLILAGACVPVQTAPTSTNDSNLVSTFVAMTLSALPSPVPPTETPLPAPTEPVLSTPTIFVSPALASTLVIPTTKPDYACDIINQRPYDDTEFRRNEDFDIRWTIVNTGTLRWENETHITYQDGPKMTDVKKVDLPRLKPGEQYEVVLDATAPDKPDRQIMVWAVIGPGKTKGSSYWMCYPYVRIMVKNK